MPSHVGSIRRSSQNLRINLGQCIVPPQFSSSQESATVNIPWYDVQELAVQEGSRRGKSQNLAHDMDKPPWSEH